MPTYHESLPLISVIMPAYQAEAYIETAIRSVMAQTYPNWELLVLDDGSRDGTASIVQALASEDARVRYLPNPGNMGVAKTRNRGLDLAQGEYVALLDSDDLWLPEKLSCQLELLQREKADLVCCSYAIIDGQGSPIKRDCLVQPRIAYRQLLKENTIGCSTVLFTRQILQRYRFREDFYHEDYTLWLQLLRDGHTVVGCPEVLAQWRYIANSRSFNKVNGAKKRWQIYRSYLGLPLLPAMYYFACYTLAGLRKYR